MTTQWLDFKEVKQKVPIKFVIDKLGILEQFVEKGEKLRGICPLKQHTHNRVTGGNPQQFVVDLEKGLFFCHGDCQRGGSSIDLVKGVLGISDQHARLWFIKECGSILNLSKPKSMASPIKKAREDNHEQSASPQTQEKEAGSIAAQAAVDKPLEPLRFTMRLEIEHPYLDQRGVTLETRQLYQIGFCQPGPRQRYFDGFICTAVHRWPQKKPDENPCAYIGRWPALASDCPAKHSRYKLPQGFPKQQVVYGLEQALARTENGPLIIVESIWSTWHLHQAGFASVALLGSRLSEQQAELLYQTGRPLLVMLDADQAGTTGSEAAVKLLLTKPACFVNQVQLPHGAKPHHLSPAELSSLLAR